eukprot:TRINITY_DN56223_c0_g1_i1.p2 TRINITY_DN56223_c0_g1~~TRINITY_DN56223_c0_g1_i1.p2  ORF type:complete len:172 (+),score=58.54 TRINITY_DN56223_c0_g1_i1:75-518(+)
MPASLVAFGFLGFYGTVAALPFLATMGARPVNFEYPDYEDQLDLEEDELAEGQQGDEHDESDDEAAMMGEEGVGQGGGAASDGSGAADAGPGSPTAQRPSQPQWMAAPEEQDIDQEQGAATSVQPANAGSSVGGAAVLPVSSAPGAQ